MRRFAVRTALLGGSGAWQNLGLWPAQSYDAACEGLALRVGEAAGLRPGLRALELGAGSGAGLRLWRERFGAEAVGIELEPPVGAEVMAGPALRGGRLAVGDARFEAILAVDCAYHLAPAAELARACAAALEPGGVVALTTLVSGRRGCGGRLLERAAAIPRGALLPLGELRAAFARHFAEVEVTALTREVLWGFARHVATTRPRPSPGWAKIVGTAVLASVGAGSGALTYVLLRAREPAR